MRLRVEHPSDAVNDLPQLHGLTAARAVGVHKGQYRRPLDVAQRHERRHGQRGGHVRRRGDDAGGVLERLADDTVGQVGVTLGPHPQTDIPQRAEAPDRPRDLSRSG